MSIARLVCVLSALWVGGCLFDTSEQVPLYSRADAADVSAPEAGADAEAGEPMYPARDLPHGELCSAPSSSAQFAECNAVTQDCADGKICDLFYDQNNDRFVAACREAKAGEQNGGAEGDNCGTSEPCRPGYRCVVGRCRRYCSLEDAAGCRSGQWCDRPFDASFGVCSTQCQ